MLEGKRIVITGAATGIGRATVLVCAREGAIVGIGYHSSGSAAATLGDEVEARFQRRCHLLQLDVRDPDAVKSRLGHFAELEGGIDGLVNNAAINHPGLLVTQGLDTIEDQIAVNLVGTIICSQEVIPVMLEQRCGVIVNVGSVAARRPGRGQSVYAATKGAIEALTRALAVEYGRKGLRVHTVRPGPVDTPMLEATRHLAGNRLQDAVPVRRLGEPAEVAELIAFLLSDRASYISGSVHNVDGGLDAGLLLD